MSEMRLDAVMRKLTSYLACLGAGGLAVLCTAASSSVIAAETPWTIRDSIEMTYFVSDSVYRYIYDVGITPSPDGKRFFVTTLRGDLEEDLNHYELHVYEVDGVIDALRSSRKAPLPSVAHAVKTRALGGSELLGIRNPTWAHDSGSIYFIEIDLQSHATLKRLDVASGRVTSVTDESKYVDEFKLDRDVVLFREKVSEKTLWEESDLPYPLNYVDSEYFQRALSWKIPRYASYIVGDAGVARQFGHVESRHTLRSLGDISPDGKWIVAAKSLDSDQRPTFWSEYKLNNRDSGTQFYLFNISSLEGQAMLNAPVGRAITNWSSIDVLWFPDSSKVILVNTLLPLQEDEPWRRDTSYIVEYDLTSSSARTIAPLPGRTPGRPYAPIVEVRWLEPGRRIVVEYKEGGTLRRIQYARQKNGWVGGELESEPIDANVPATDEPPALWGGLDVRIRQGLNDPPRLVAALDGKELLLSPEDPVVATAKLLPAEKMEWKDARGKPWKGVLVLPGFHSRTSKLPLVIQLGQVNFGLFSPDGVMLKPGHSAQAFAARGYAVLTFAETRESEVITSTVDELPDFQGGVDAAVQMLESRGLIDSTKVGLIGHSRMGFRSFYIATHPKGFVPAVVVVQDSFSGGFTEYVLAQSMFPNPLGFEELYSREGLPFWENKSAWMNSAAGFSLENMASPLLITYLMEEMKGPPVLGMTAFMEAYGGLHRLGRPVEAVSFPGGSHNPMQPKQRAANMQLVIDWLEFWISGKESAEAADSERNSRWRSMREKWTGKPGGAKRGPDTAS